jgi:predicted permease
MPQILTILLTTVAPIVLVAGLGALFNRWKRIETNGLSTLVVYIGSPALAFHSIATSAIDAGELSQLVLFAILCVVIITAVGWLITVGARMDRLTSSAFVLSTALINGLNYGVPLNEFAFGQAGLARAIIVGVIFAMYSFSVGVFLASWGKASTRQALLNMLKIPLPYAAILGLVVNLTGTPVPPLALRFAQILGGLAIPLMLLLLGIQISQASLQGQWRIMFGASFVRLLGGAAIGLLLAFWLGLEGINSQVAIVEAAMPTAVTAGVLAIEFNSDAKLVGGIIMLSTLLSLLTLPFIILLVG